ncbi:histidine phosphatase family protein [Afipia sp. P52-10]|uniref:histidine phosphatase family protein n=1 Tax=Afipia sp. P52-10 TaxID=1429916 RepID=UPI0004AE1D73|nr:histidine phosphatase family protein [Afipia sp. P52-10]
MTTRVDLVRHGHHALLNRVLCGRMPGVGLDDLGRAQMETCAAEVNRSRATVIQSSPQPRALQSAAIIGRACGLPVEVVAAVDEIDVGAWTGLTFDRLAKDHRWRTWNERRGQTRPPQGESAHELQRRMIRHLETIRQRPPHTTIVIVSHAEPIRVTLMHYLKLALDDYAQVEVSPASLSTLLIDGSRTLVTRINGMAVP